MWSLNHATLSFRAVLVTTAVVERKSTKTRFYYFHVRIMMKVAHTTQLRFTRQAHMREMRHPQARPSAAVISVELLETIWIHPFYDSGVAHILKAKGERL